MTNSETSKFLFIMPYRSDANFSKKREVVLSIFEGAAVLPDERTVSAGSEI